ncbi:MAG: 50S ribosomal protein L33 [Caryophanon sp.]|nr:50S ribosomal protein L33 [Caryophanon latum]MEE1130077.1 50S ribosomal protein L33 [Caryophanon sp.]
MVFKRQNAKKGDKMANKVVLCCEKCGSRNYTLPKKSDVATRLELKKFCSRCNEHTIHKETI